MGREHEGKEDVSAGVKLAGKFADVFMLSLALLEHRVQTLHELRGQQRKAIG